MVDRISGYSDVAMLMRCLFLALHLTAADADFIFLDNPKMIFKRLTDEERRNVSNDLHEVRL